MRKQAAVVFTVTVLALALVCAAQDRLAQATVSITGKVVTLDEHPAGNARVELRNTLTGASVQAAYTNSVGQFEISGVAPGTYLVVATSQLDEVQETIKVPQMAANLVLHLPRTFNATDGNQNMISVQQLKIPSKAQSALKHAQEALSKGNLDQAWKEATKALSIYPQYGAALVLRGILKLDQKNSEGALSDLEESIKDDPGYAMGYIALGAAYNSLSRFDDALRSLDRGIALAPTSWQAYFETGKAYIGRGDFATSLRQLDKAQQYAPDAYAPLHLVKAHALLGLKSYNEAISELEVYLSKDPTGKSSDEARDTLQRVRAFMATNRK